MFVVTKRLWWDSRHAVEGVARACFAGLVCPDLGQQDRVIKNAIQLSGAGARSVASQGQSRPNGRQ